MDWDLEYKECNGDEDDPPDLLVDQVSEDHYMQRSYHQEGQEQECLGKKKSPVVLTAQQVFMNKTVP